MSEFDDTIRVYTTSYVAIREMMAAQFTVATVANPKLYRDIFWMSHRIIPDETLERDEIRRGADVPEWHVTRLQEAMAEYAAKVSAKKVAPDFFKPCTDQTHPRGPHLHLPGGAIEVTDDRIANAAESLAFPETDAAGERFDRAIAGANARLDALEFKSRVAALLRKMEWSREIPESGAPEFDPGWELCDFCEAVKPGPHRDDCELAALLKEAQE